MKICAQCTEEKDTRPYGPDGSEICFACGTSSPKMEEDCEQRLHEAMEKAGAVTDIVRSTPEGIIPFVGKVPEPPCEEEMGQS